MLTRILAITALVATANADTKNQCHQHTSEGVFFNLEGLKSNYYYATTVNDDNNAVLWTYCRDSPAFSYTSSSLSNVIPVPLNPIGEEVGINLDENNNVAGITFMQSASNS